MNNPPTNTMEELIFTAQHKGRLDSIISKELNFSRNRVKKMLEENNVYVNDIVCKNASMKIFGNENIKIYIPTVANHLQAQESNLEIVYQDSDIAVIVKPAGITVHPCPSCEEQTLVHQLLHHFPELQKLEGERPGIVHRLDKDTSGLMIIALHEEARLRLVEAFANRLVHKTYLALVAGQCDNGESQESIGRHPSIKTKMAQVPLNKGGREAYSTWERLFPPTLEEAVTKQGKSLPIPKTLQSSFSLMAVKIFTGRTHQIRVHLSEAGFPLLGDNIYCQTSCSNNEGRSTKKSSNKNTGQSHFIVNPLNNKNTIAQSASRQMLHAWKLQFSHPMTGEELSFTSPLPTDFLETILRLWHKDLAHQRIIITGSSGTGKSALLKAFAKKDIPIFSADSCVQQLYEPNEDAWYLLKNQYGQRFIHEKAQNLNSQHNTDSLSQKRKQEQILPAVDKNALFGAMQDPHMRREIENIIHPLVFARLETFFHESALPVTSFDSISVECAPLNTKTSYKIPNGKAINSNTIDTENSNTIDTDTHHKTLQKDDKTQINISTENAFDLIISKIKEANNNHFCHFAVAEIPLWFESSPSDIQDDYYVICVTCDNDIRLERLKKRGWTEETIAIMDSWQWTQTDKAKNAQYTIDNTNVLKNTEETLAESAKQIMKDIAQKQQALLEKKLRILQKNMNTYKNI